MAMVFLFVRRAGVGSTTLFGVVDKTETARQSAEAESVGGLLSPVVGGTPALPPSVGRSLLISRFCHVEVQCEILLQGVATFFLDGFLLRNEFIDDVLSIFHHSKPLLLQQPVEPLTQLVEGWIRLEPEVLATNLAHRAPEFSKAIEHFDTSGTFTKQYTISSLLSS